MNAHTLPKWLAEAHAIVADLDQSNWVEVVCANAAGDAPEWHPLGEAAASAYWELGKLRTKSLAAITGYASFDAAWADDGHGYYLRTAQRLGTVSDLIEAEFARRDGRPARRFLPDENLIADIRAANADLSMDSRVTVGMGGAL